MTDRNSLLASLAETIKDYRFREIDEPTPDHVDRWVSQFDEAVQVPLLREVNHVLSHTYMRRDFVDQFFANQLRSVNLVGSSPCEFWRAATVLNIQRNGRSQAEIRQLFATSLRNACGLEIDNCGVGASDRPYVYLDDVLFSGGRVRTDLSDWIRGKAPAKATLHILVIAAHRLGEWQSGKDLRKIAHAAGKDISIQNWAALRIENRKTYRESSEVLWPTELPENELLRAYIAEEERFPFEPRPQSRSAPPKIFSSEDGRRLLERELLMAGMRIRSFCKNPSAVMRPLGFSRYGLGFGSMIVTFRNCPNNAPLALWWGDPTAGTNHPLSKWYPLVPRKVYAEEANSDVFGF